MDRSSCHKKSPIQTRLYSILRFSSSTLTKKTLLCVVLHSSLRTQFRLPTRMCNSKAFPHFNDTRCNICMLLKSRPNLRSEDWLQERRHQHTCCLHRVDSTDFSKIRHVTVSLDSCAMARDPATPMSQVPKHQKWGAHRQHQFKSNNQPKKQQGRHGVTHE